MKRLTYEQIAARKEKAARFVDHVLDDPERADEIEEESVEDYAARRNFAIENENPRRGAMTNAQLQEQIQDLEQENDDLRERLNHVIDIAAADEYDDDDEGEEAEDGEPGEFEEAA